MDPNLFWLVVLIWSFAGGFATCVVMDTDLYFRLGYWVEDSKLRMTVAFVLGGPILWASGVLATFWTVGYFLYDDWDDYIKRQGRYARSSRD